MSAEFSLSLAEPPTDAGPDFVGLEATVTCRGFSGHTPFTLARRDLNTYLTDLRAVCESRAIAALLVGGWDAANERLRLRIAPAGRSGQFHAYIDIAMTGPRTDQWQRVETDFVCSPQDLSAFLTDLEQLATNDGAGAARLCGDPDAIA